MRAMIAKRVIPCLDVHDGKVTRGVQFGKAEAGELRNVGDPVELALRYNEQGADEMVFFDITATAHGRASAEELMLILSAPARSMVNMSSTDLTPPPTVSGMKH